MQNEEDMEAINNGRKKMQTISFRPSEVSTFCHVEVPILHDPCFLPMFTPARANPPPALCKGAGPLTGDIASIEPNDRLIYIIVYSEG